MNICICCGDEAERSVRLFTGPQDPKGPLSAISRYYIPSQSAQGPRDAEEAWFCRECMRQVEDNLRATILYIQAENSRVEIKPATVGTKRVPTKGCRKFVPIG